MSEKSTRRRFPRRALAAVLLLAALWFVPSALALIVMGASEDVPEAKADCIFVPGMAVYGPREPGQGLMARLEKALALYQEKRAPLIFVSGGNKGDHSESEVMVEWLRRNGVPAESIATETQARSTRENGLYSGPLMRSRGIKTALIVSQWFHLPRVGIALRDEGIATINVPCQGPGFPESIAFVTREAALMPVHAVGADNLLR